MNSSLLVRFPFAAPLLALTLCLAVAPQASAQGEADVYVKTLNSTGFVVVPKGKDAKIGTCWIVDANQRLAVTNVHVVGESDKCLVIFPRVNNGQVVTAAAKYSKGDAVAGKVLARDAKRDLALVKLERLPAGIKALELAPQSIGEGGRVWAVGNSGMANKGPEDGTLWRLRQGTVKTSVFMLMNLIENKQKLETRFIHSDSGAKPGDSGGPVVNEQGQLVGVTSCTTDAGDYAIDVSEVRTFLARHVPAPNLPPPSVGAVGTWTVRWKHKGNDLCAGLTLNADGSGQWQGGSKLFPGTFTIVDGKLTLKMTGSGLPAVPMQVTWMSNDEFRFTVPFSDGPGEFTATRR